jgi:uncharacterized protein (TIGR02246 family)
MKRALLVCVLFLLVITAFARPVEKPSEDAEVRRTLQEFLTAFENLDMDRFMTFFANDASVFYPRGTAQRVYGREAIQRYFAAVFEEIRGQQTHPPYMHVDPKDLKIQVMGDTAVITFHLDDRPGTLNRRTIIMHRTKGVWKIVHLHASEVKRP